jgi:class 3 adenylate cyclase/TolB-like protein
MKETAQKRQLAAIMFTDIVGYTALMGESEEKALHIRRINREIHQQQIEAVGGTWLKEMGDGTMASFDTITEAVQAAIEIRKICKKELGIELKIGIHLGELIHEDEDVFGDGVNIASRIQELAVGGGILISEPVYNEITNKEGLDAVLVGLAKLKNIDKPVNIYQILDGDLEKPTIKLKSKSRSKLIAIAAAIALAVIAVGYFVIWPKVFHQPVLQRSIAILPFLDNSGIDEFKYYGVGIATEVRSKLSQSKNFDFISAMQATKAYDGSNLSPTEIGNELKVNYLLTGIYQVVGDKIKVDVELVDAETGNSIWQESFNKLTSDIFKVQADIAGMVLNKFNLQGQIEDEAPTNNLEAYGRYLLAMEYLNRGQNLKNNPKNKLHRENLQAAIKLDSGFIDAWVALIDFETLMLWFGQSDNKEKVSAYVDEFKRRFPDSWKNNLVQGFYAYHGNRDYNQGMEFFKEVLIHDPENFAVNSNLGDINRRKLQLKQALQYYTKALHQDPKSTLAWRNISHVFGIMGDYAASLKATHKRKELGDDITDFLFMGNYNKGIPSPPELIKETWQELFNKAAQRNYTGVFALLDSTNYKASNYEIALLNWLTNQFDSARYYAALSTEEQKGTSWVLFAILGQKEEARQSISKWIEIHTNRGDSLQLCRTLKNEIEVLCILGEYEEATSKLIAMNERFPQYGDYGSFNYITFDKIKKDYPPFLEALNNLNLPRKLVLEDFELRKDL